MAIGQEAKAAVKELVRINTTRFADGGADIEAWQIAQDRKAQLTQAMSPQAGAVAARATAMVASRRYRAAALAR